MVSVLSYYWKVCRRYEVIPLRALFVRLAGNVEVVYRNSRPSHVVSSYGVCGVEKHMFQLSLPHLWDWHPESHLMSPGSPHPKSSEMSSFLSPPLFGCLLDPTWNTMGWDGKKTRWGEGGGGINLVCFLFSDGNKSPAMNMHVWGPGWHVSWVPSLAVEAFVDLPRERRS